METKNYILISGSTSGMGMFIAEKLSDKYNLVLNGRNQEKVDSVIAKCKNQDNHKSWIYDLKNINDIEGSLKQFLADNTANISHFIHCAGFLKMLPLRNISFANIEETMNVNFNSAVLIIKTLINKKLNGTGFKNIVFISSTASIMGAKAFNVYSASKGALDALMRSLAVELAPATRVNSILPGAVQTAMTESIYENAELMTRMNKEYPLGLGGVEDIYEMVDFLISDRSKWITGQQFVVDGGRSINITTQS